jgi:cytochrome P450
LDSALNDKEIIGQALIFMIAGYETTSVLMSFFFYVMATEPIIQEKVYEEIRQELGDVSQINVEERGYLIILFRMKLLMKNSVNFNIWIWLLMKLFECIRHLSG